jgi:hypothetical protein
MWFFCSFLHFTYLAPFTNSLLAHHIANMSGDTPSLPRLGFDVVVDRIAALYRVHSTSTGAVRAVSKTVKTSFIEAGGKRKVDATVDDPAMMGVTPSTRRRVASVTPASSVTLPSVSIPSHSGNTPRSDHRHLFDSTGSGSMLINGPCDIVPPHAQHQPSVLQHIY